MTVTNNTIHSSATKVDDIDFGKIFGIVIDYKISIFVIIIISVLFGVIKAITDDVSQESSTTAEIELIKSRMVLGETVDHLNLTTMIKPEYTPFIGEGIARIQGYQPILTLQNFKTLLTTPIYLTIDDATTKTFSITNEKGNVLTQGHVGELINSDGFELLVNQLNGESGQVFTIYKQSRRNAIVQLQNALSIYEKGKGTGMLVLTMTSPYLIMNQNVLNDIASNYVLQNVARKSEEAENGLEFATKQLVEIKAKLTAAEDKLNAYRTKAGAINLNAEANATLKMLITLEGQLSELTFKEAELAKRFTKEHPAYIALLDKRHYLLQQQAKFERQIKKMPQSQQDILRLTRDVEVNQQIYMQLLNKTQELRLVKAGTVGNVRIVDNAESNPTPIAPRKKLIIILSLFVGLIISLAQAFVRSAFRRGIENPDEIEALGLPVYASIPMSDWQENINKKNKMKQALTVSQTLLAVANPADLSIEALRSLRTSLHFAMMEAKNNILMIVGPSPEIGKSFVSANMVVVIAKTGSRVLIIDADMRQGRLDRQFCISHQCGLSDYLSGQKAHTDIIKQSGVDNLDIISCGDTPPNPSELLMHPRFKELMTWASANYDMVVIDTPPILAVTDAAIVGAHVGTTLMVGRFEKSVVKEVEISKQRFEQNGIEVKGFILNAVVRKASGYYGNYGYYQYSYVNDKK